MKKVISLLLTAVMLMSSVVAIAAPTVDYVFYAANEENPGYYVFGSYTNTSVSGISVKATDAGVYLNEKKYSYLGNIENSNLMAEPKFGIKFVAPEGKLNNLDITPYIEDKFSIKKGVERNLDPETNELKEASNAKLLSLFLNRSSRDRGNSGYLMIPAFDPNETSYTVEGYYGDQNTLLSQIEFIYDTQDPNAVATLRVAYNTVNENGVATGNADNKAYIDVVAADGKTKNTYTLQFLTNGNYRASRDSATDFTVGMTANGYFTEYYDSGTITKDTTTATSYIYPAKAPDRYKYCVLTFPIADGIAEAKNINLKLNVTLTDYSYVKNLKLTSRAYDENGLGDIVGELVIPDPSKFTSSYKNIAIDVTDIIKNKISKDPSATSCQIALQLTDCELKGDVSSNTIPGIIINNLTATDGTRPYLLFKK